MIAHYTVQDLKNFELEVAEIFNSGKIKAPVHLSDGNESHLIEIFKNVKDTDWVICSWRSHYQCLLKGVPRNELMDEIKAGRSISLCFPDYQIFSSAIVGGQIPIAVGLALAEKRKESDRHIWCFIGDMSFESGIFYEVHKYARNFDLPLYFVIEDNGVSTYTPTDATWNKKRDIPDDVIHYNYKSKYPHYGSGKWVVF